MPEIKTAPYEILVRWNCEKGEKFGHIRGVHQATHTCVVDDSGDIVMRDHETAQPLERSEIVPLLGERFADFVKQLETERANHAATHSELRDAHKALSDANEQVAVHKDVAERAKEIAEGHMAFAESVREQHRSLLAAHKVLLAEHEALKAKCAP